MLELPECGALTFSWDFDNDGVVDEVSDQGTSERTFTNPGTYTTRVTVGMQLASAITEVLFTTTVQDPATATTPTSDPRPAPGSLRLLLKVQEFPVETTEFTAASPITASSILENRNDFGVHCATPSHGATESNFFLYEDGVEVAHAPGGTVQPMQWPVYFAPGTTVVDDSRVDFWSTPSNGDFNLYPGVFTVSTTPKFYCDVPVFSSAVTIVVRP